MFLNVLILRYYLSEVHLVKDDLVRMADAKETCDECKNRDDPQSELVIPFSRRLLLHLLDRFVQRVLISVSVDQDFLLFLSTPLSEGGIRGRHVSRSTGRGLQAQREQGGG